MSIKVKRDKRTSKYWYLYFDGDMIGCWHTPREARHKGRMWWMWLTTGNHRYLRNEQ